jgi:uncharacterized membrane protein
MGVFPAGRSHTVVGTPIRRVINIFVVCGIGGLKTVWLTREVPRQAYRQQMSSTAVIAHSTLNKGEASGPNNTDGDIR